MKINLTIAEKFFLGLIFAFVYFASTFFIEFKFAAVAVLFPIYVLIKQRFSFKNFFGYFENSKQQILLAAFFCCAALNFLLNNQNTEVQTASLFFMVLYPLNFYFAKIFNFKFIVYFFLLLLSGEVIIGMFEYISGYNTLDYSGEVFREFDSYRLLYFTRVNGLTDSSSSFSLKLLCGFFIALSIENKRIRNVFMLFIITGLLITFNRSVMLSFILVSFVLFIRYLILNFSAVFKNNRVLLRTILFILLVGLITPEIEFQMLRGNRIDFFNDEQELVGSTENYQNDEYENQKNEEGQHLNKHDKRVMLSGRNDIWKAYSDFISDHILWGNGSYKYKVKEYHAHNSYLQIIASHGLLISLIVFVMIAISITKKNIVVIVIFLLVGIFQYLIFWSFSIPDFVFFAFLSHFLVLKVDLLNYPRYFLK